MNEWSQNLLVFPYADRWLVLLLLHNIIAAICLQENRWELQVDAGQMIDFAFNGLRESYCVFCGICL